MSERDSGPDNQDGSADSNDVEGHREADERGGIAGWFARRRDRSKLHRELKEVRSERNALAETNESLRADIEALRETVSNYRQKTFDMDDLMQKLGDAAASAEDDLADSPLGVADLEVELRALLTGSGEERSIGVQLSDPDNDVDPEQLSTVKFRFDRESAAIRGASDDRDRQSTQMLGASPEVPRGQVPDVRHLSVGAAREALRDAGFEFIESSAPSGTVVEQSPEPHAIGPTNATIELEVVADEGNSTDDLDDAEES